MEIIIRKKGGTRYLANPPDELIVKYFKEGWRTVNKENEKKRLERKDIRIRAKAARHLFYKERREGVKGKKKNREKNRNKKLNKIVRILKNSFFETDKWMQLRYKVIAKYGRTCMACGTTGPIHVDHIKPRSKYPKLELNFDNLQILCRACNLGKLNLDQTDWRPESSLLQKHRC